MPDLGLAIRAPDASPERGRRGPLSGSSEEGAGEARRPTTSASTERGARGAQRGPREGPVSRAPPAPPAPRAPWVPWGAMGAMGAMGLSREPRPESRDPRAIFGWQAAVHADILNTLPKRNFPPCR